MKTVIHYAECPTCHAKHRLTMKFPDNTDSITKLVKCNPSTIIPDEQQALGCGHQFSVFVPK